MEICKNCGTEKKCRHNPEHKCVCFYPTCDCGDFKKLKQTLTKQGER